MDLEPANAAAILQATADDLQGLLERGFGAVLIVRRNYGDWLRIEDVGEARFRLEYYDAVTGKSFRADATETYERVKEAVQDYFEGHWNWHAAAIWHAI